MGKGVSSGGDENALKLIAVVGTRLSERTENYWMFLRGDRMGCELYLIEAVTAQKTHVSTPCRAATWPGGDISQLCGEIRIIGVKVTGTRRGLDGGVLRAGGREKGCRRQ